MVTTTDTRSVPATRIDPWWLIAVGAVVLTTTAASIYSPDMVTGSNQEHLPLAAFTDWIWGAVAVAYLAFVRDERADATFAISVSLLWLAVAITSIAAPAFVTGTDPTTIPLAALISPTVGAIVTGFLALHATARRQ